LRLTKVQVGPLTAPSANAVSVSQAPSGAHAIVIDGSLSTGYSATSIAASQAVGGAVDLTLTAAAGALGGRSVVIVAAGNSGANFTVKGTDINGAYLSETVTGPNTSRVATRNLFYTVTAISSSGAATGNISAGVNGLLATLDTPRRLLLTTSADDSAKTFTITGTDWNGSVVTETLTGVNNSTTYTVYDYKTITSIWISAASAGTVTFGTNGIASSRPIFLDRYALAPTALQVTVSGTANYTVQQTLDDPNQVGYTSTTWVNYPESSMASATATAQGNYAYLPTCTRLLLNSQTNPGYAVLTVLQASGTVM
jgi:hypothetical protein